jgi:hypothetical protein
MLQRAALKERSDCDVTRRSWSRIMQALSGKPPEGYGLREIDADLRLLSWNNAGK